MKKLLSILFVGLFTAVGSFANASWESNCEINQCVVSSVVPEYEGDYNYKISGGLHDYIDFRLKYTPSNAEVYPSDGTIECENGLCSVNNLYDFGDENHNLFMYVEGDVSFSNCVFVSSSNSCTLTWVDDPVSDDNGNSDSLLNPGVISSGVQSGVSAFTNGLGNLIPTLLIIGLPILIIILFRKYIWSRLKHLFVGNKPRGDDIANCNLTLNKYGQFEHHIIGQYDHGDYVDIPGVGLVGKDELPYYLDDNLEFNYKQYKEDHTTFDNRDPGIPGDDYYKRSEDIEEQSRIYEKYL